MTPDSEAFELLHKVFPVLIDEVTTSPVEEGELRRLQCFLKEKRSIATIYEYVFEKIEKTLHHITVPEFWSRFPRKRPENEEIDIVQQLQEFQHVVKQLYVRYTYYHQLLERLHKVCPSNEVPPAIRKKANEETEFYKLFHTTLIGHLPEAFEEGVRHLYAITFRVFIYTHSESEELMDVAESDVCMACSRQTASCQCQAIASAFSTTNKYLSMMGILEQCAGLILTKLIQERIDWKVSETKENYATSHVNPRNKLGKETVDRLMCRLQYYMYEKYALTIIDQFFQIIINFPLSQPAVNDLKVCLKSINLKFSLVEKLSEMLKSRLLHPGVDTPDILTGYVSALRTLSHFDPSGILLHTITQPIKEYLRGRPETVRCIVTSLTGDGTSDLAEELVKSEAVKPKESTNEKLEESDWDDWNPNPVDEAPAALQSDWAGKTADIIAMVVGIYGSKEIFVNEYRNLLAERLLSPNDFNAEREIKNLELLKVRFGETLLHSCDVMLKDITDSKRINTHIFSPESGLTEQPPFRMSALIVSSQFWPTFKKETMELPTAIKDVFDKFTKAYESYKVNRTLQWTPLNGKVTIEVENNGKVQEMQVTPAQATIIIHFSEQPQWDLDSLGLKMNMPPIVLRKRLVFWQSQGMIRETKENFFVLVDSSADSGKQTEQAHTQSNDVCDEDEAESAMESASDQREEELQVFWSYIEAMLTNLDSLPLDRIHQMLKLFASQVDFTQDELKSILQRKVREHKLVYAGGVYQLPKT
ncbi:AGAP005048-PA-like protein [Anopheles sinensis]|uniref:Anaphase-promoting complex subunit 2 n=1 Tax=Anopheles sinensis TaxID=74873 RepID=A0A084WCU6_ANOSI|nr:AGAP005048-PA-like protein [Anopheles sinensis]